MISRALRPGGRNLIQLPNVLYAKERLPQRSWIPASDMIELVEHRWNKKARRMEGKMVAARFGEVLENLDGIEFSQRLYTVDELREIYASVGMELLTRLPRQRPPEGAEGEPVRDLRRGAEARVTDHAVRDHAGTKAMCRNAGKCPRTASGP